MKPVRMYTSALCPYCTMAKRLLARYNVAIEELRIDLNPALGDDMRAQTQRRTVPQIFIGDTHVGGFDDLAALERRAELLPLLQD